MFSRGGYRYCNSVTFDFIVIESAQSVQAIGAEEEASEEEQSIDDLLDSANVVSNDDGYILDAEGDLLMEEDLENGINGRCFG